MVPEEPGPHQRLLVWQDRSSCILLGRSLPFGAHRKRLLRATLDIYNRGTGRVSYVQRTRAISRPCEDAVSSALQAREAERDGGIGSRGTLSQRPPGISRPSSQPSN